MARSKNFFNLVAGNWKMNPPTKDEARSLVGRVELGLVGLPRGGVEVVFCPPYVYLPVIQHIVHFGKLGAQNIAAEPDGPHTGEISPAQLRQFQAEYVIIGHSERRELGENDDVINKKLRLALANKLKPILCVGWGAKQGMPGAQLKHLLLRQLRGALRGVKFAKLTISIAYEPAWAISRGPGTAKRVNPKHAGEICRWIGTQFPKARGLYGGSLDAKNVGGFAAQPGIRGGLVGGASLLPGDFLKIAESFGQ